MGVHIAWADEWRTSGRSLLPVHAQSRNCRRRDRDRASHASRDL